MATWAERNAMTAEAAGDVTQAAYWHRIKAEVDSAPPLTDEQKAKLRILLRPTREVSAPRTRIAGDPPGNRTPTTNTATTRVEAA